MKQDLARCILWTPNAVIYEPLVQGFQKFLKTAGHNPKIENGFPEFLYTSFHNAPTIDAALKEHVGLSLCVDARPCSANTKPRHPLEFVMRSTGCSNIEI